MGNLQQPLRRHQCRPHSHDPKGYQVEHVVKGDTMTEVLGYVQYDAEDMVENIRRRSEQALQENQITLQESQLLLNHYEQSLGTIYLPDLRLAANL